MGKLCPSQSVHHQFLLLVLVAGIGGSASTCSASADLPSRATGYILPVQRVQHHEHGGRHWHYWSGLFPQFSQEFGAVIGRSWEGSCASYGLVYGTISAAQRCSNCWRRLRIFVAVPSRLVQRAFYHRALNPSVRKSAARDAAGGGGGAAIYQEVANRQTADKQYCAQRIWTGWRARSSVWRGGSKTALPVGTSPRPSPRLGVKLPVPSDQRC